MHAIRRPIDVRPGALGVFKNRMQRNDALGIEEEPEAIERLARVSAYAR